MTKIGHLIEKLCPQGVEFRALGELGKFSNIGVDDSSRTKNHL